MLTYIKESIEELKNHVTLPPRAESSNLMVVVAVFSILFALATWGVDTVFSEVIKLYFENVLN
jgi:preprotein translocase subunit SecE